MLRWNTQQLCDVQLLAFSDCLNLGPADILIFVQFDPVTQCKRVRTVPGKCNDQSWSFEAVVDEREVRWRQYCQYPTSNLWHQDLSSLQANAPNRSKKITCFSPRPTRPLITPFLQSWTRYRFTNSAYGRLPRTTQFIFLNLWRSQNLTIIFDQGPQRIHQLSKGRPEPRRQP